MARSAGQRDHHAIERAVIVTVVMATALGIAVTIADAARQHLDWPERAVNLLMGGITAVIAVLAVSWLQVWRDHRPMTELGLVPGMAAARTFGLGFGVTFGTGLLVAALGWALGWVEIVDIDGPVLVGWLLFSVAYIFLYEALPEELSLRGYAFTRLRERFDTGGAVIIGLGSFCAVPPTAGMIRWLLAPLAGLEAPGLHLIPEGETPLGYFSMLVAFGYVLHLARIATGSLWTAMGLHLAFILFNRVLLGGEDAGNGLSLTLSGAGRSLILPAYLTITAVILSMMQQRTPDAASPRPSRG